MATVETRRRITRRRMRHVRVSPRIGTLAGFMSRSEEKHTRNTENVTERSLIRALRDKYVESITDPEQRQVLRDRFTREDAARGF